MAVLRAVIFLCLLVLSAHAGPVRSVVVDAGHGGFDHGITAPSGPTGRGIKEKDFALRVALALETALKEEFKTVRLTRRTDRQLSFKERTPEGADIFISIHASLSDSPSVYIAWYPEGDAPAKEEYRLESRQRRFLPQSRELAGAVTEALKGEFKTIVSVKEMPLPVLGSAGAPALLIEVPLGWDASKAARAILKGIHLYEGK